MWKRKKVFSLARREEKVRKKSIDFSYLPCISTSFMAYLILFLLAESQRKKKLIALTWVNIWSCKRGIFYTHRSFLRVWLCVCLWKNNKESVKILFWGWKVQVGKDTTTMRGIHLLNYEKGLWKIILYSLTCWNLKLIVFWNFDTC